jgi:tetratricopeptide (TPR) repeat protein
MNDAPIHYLSAPRAEQTHWLQLTSATADLAVATRDERARSNVRIFRLDAEFESSGTWSGVAQLAEAAYLGLLEMGQEAIVEQHLLELHMALPSYRDVIRPKYLCLTDTAAAAEKSRFYALDRAYRLVNGLVGLILQWRRAVGGDDRWIVVVDNFDRAQHLATRFFVELARRAAGASKIDVVVETRRDASSFASSRPGIQAVRVVRWIIELAPADVTSPIGDAETKALEAQVAAGSDALLEEAYPKLLAHYAGLGDRLAAARIALRVFVLYNSHGYYHEAKSMMDLVLPHFDEIVGTDEVKRIDYVSKMNICLVQANDTARGLSVVGEFAASYLTRPHLLANMNYILGMHHLRFAKVKSVALAEQHILRAVELIAGAKSDRKSWPNPFQKVFIDNGLAFLRARQGRHTEALDLCKSGYEFLTREMGEERHRLHRSVLQYNIAQVYLMLGRPDEGLSYYAKAIEMDPYYSEYHNEIGNLLQELERYGEAIEHYALAILYSAPYPEVYFNKAVCHARREEPDAALGAFDQSLGLQPHQPEAHALRADVLRELGREDEALAGYDVAIALGYDSPAVRINRAVLHYENGAFDLALADMDHVIARDDREPAYFENRAAIHQAMNREDLRARDLAAAERCREDA